jgi:hypothetical protein
MDFFQKALVEFGECAMSLKTKLFACKHGDDTDFIWRTHYDRRDK